MTKYIPTQLGLLELKSFIPNNSTVNGCLEPPQFHHILRLAT